MGLTALLLCAAVATAQEPGSEGPDLPPGEPEKLTVLQKQVERERRRRSRQRQQLSEPNASRLRRDARLLGSLRNADRLPALERLADSGPASLETLVKCLSSRNGYQVRYGILALERLGMSEAVEPLMTLVRDPRTTDPDRFYAVGALANLNDPRALDLLLGRLNDSVEAVSLAAEVGVRRLGGRLALPHLLEGLGSESENRREVSRRVLRRMRHDAQVWLQKNSALGSEPGPGGATPAEEPGNARLDAFFRALDPKVPLAPAAPALIAYPTRKFQVISDLPEAAALPLGQEAAEFRTVVAGWLKVDTTRLAPVVIRAFSRREDFLDYGASHDFNFRHFSEYYYSFLLREVVIHELPDPMLRTRRLRHEIVHDLIEQVCGPTPPWLHEGLAECFEGVTDLEGPTLTPGPNHEWTTLAGTTLDEGGAAAIAELLELDGEAFYGAGQAHHYALAWALTHTLAAGHAGAAGPQLLRRAVTALHAGRGHEEVTRLFRGDLSPERCAALIREHLQSLR